MSTRPPHWAQCTINDLIDGIEGGLNFKCIERPPIDDEPGLVKLSAVSWGRFREEESKTVPSEIALDESLRIRVGDLLISRANTLELVGACVIVDKIHKRLYLSDKVLRLQAADAFKRWLMYYLQSREGRQQIEAASSGNQLSMRNISRQAIAAIQVPLPPLEEQKRIADKLDRLLAAVAACKARLDAVPAILKRFRQSVLLDAASGSLTRDWREEHQPPEWVTVTLGDLIIGKPRNGYSPKPVEFETSVKSLTLTATTSGKFDSTRFKYVDESIPPESHLWLKSGDILIQRANTLEYVGVSAVYSGPDTTYIYPDLMMKAVPNGRAATKFIHYCLLSESVRDYFRHHATGTAGNMPKINQKIAIATPIPLPSAEEQNEIVRRVDALLSTADLLEDKLKAARARIDKLMQSLLAKAFRGELVPQDPNDEPAEQLLARIRAQRQEPAASGGRRSRAKVPDEA